MLAAPMSSLCCRSLLRPLLCFGCKGCTLGGVKPVLDGAPPLLSCFTQLGLVPIAGDGLGKAGLASDMVALSGGL